MNGTDPIDIRLRAIQGRARIIGAVGLAAWLAALAYLFVQHGPLRIAFGAYLIGFLCVLGITLGSLAILMLQHLTGGRWGRTIRRVAEAASRTLPVLAVLFVPVLLGIKSLYIWSHEDVVAHDEVLQHKQLYLNIQAFVVRAAIYFASWIILATILNRWARRQEQSPADWNARKFRLLSGPGLVIYGLMMTFAAFDWGMSLEPHWYSTIYGVLFLVGQGAAGLAFCVAVTLLVTRFASPNAEIASQTLADLGSLLLAFVMLWAYISLSQFLIIWAGNLPEEIPWYLNRMRAGWGGIGLVLVFFHFFVPFVLLLMGRLKRNPRTLARLALLILLVRMFDLVWILAPSFSTHGHYDGIWVALLAPAAIVGLGGIWLSLVMGQLRARSLLPYPESPEESPHARVEAAS